MFVFDKRVKLDYLEKNLSEQRRANNKLNPYANKNQCLCNVIILKALHFKVFNYALPNFLVFAQSERFLDH